MPLQLTTFDMADHLDSEEAIAEYLSQVMADGDDDELLRPAPARNVRTITG